jgi:hypothetical protein
MRHKRRHGHETKRRQGHETKRRQDHEKKRRQGHETKRRQSHETQEEATPRDTRGGKATRHKRRQGHETQEEARKAEHLEQLKRLPGTAIAPTTSCNDGVVDGQVGRIPIAIGSSTRPQRDVRGGRMCGPHQARHLRSTVRFSARRCEGFVPKHTRGAVRGLHLLEDTDDGVWPTKTRQRQRQRDKRRYQKKKSPSFLVKTISKKEQKDARQDITKDDTRRDERQVEAR